MVPNPPVGRPDLAAARDRVRKWGSAQPVRIVIAEDDDDIREGLVELFNLDGFEVACVATGSGLSAYLAKCEESGAAPDVVITDHRMPGRTGLDVLEELNQRGSRMPVIVITAWGEEARHHARTLGAAAVFDKPVNLQELREAVFFLGTKTPRSAVATDRQSQEFIRRASKAS